MYGGRVTENRLAVRAGEESGGGKQRVGQKRGGLLLWVRRGRWLAVGSTKHEQIREELARVGGRVPRWLCQRTTGGDGPVSVA